MIKIVEGKKVYQLGADGVNALDRVSLEIAEGEFVAIVGASGSGKSTLMNIIGCLDRLSGGSYYLYGEDISGIDERRLSGIRNKKIGFVFQSFNLIPTLSAFENVELPLIYGGVSKAERQRLVREALAVVGLSDRAKHKPTQLSGGQQQRAAIARAIAAKPPIILADEPCGNLDTAAGQSIMRLLKELNEAGRTVVLITHNENDAAFAGRTIRISDGKIVPEGA